MQFKLTVMFEKMMVRAYIISLGLASKMSDGEKIHHRTKMIIHKIGEHNGNTVS